MRTVIIKPKKGGRSFAHRPEFYEREIEDGLIGCTPGQWVLVQEGKSPSPLLVAMANPLVNQGPCLRVLRSCTSEKQAKSFDPLAHIKYRIDQAIAKRDDFSYFDGGSRILYGDADGLPGVIADLYVNCVLLQINTAGMDIYREDIKSYIAEKTGKKVFFLDNEEYRKAEGLPIFDKEDIPHIEVRESGIEYNVSTDVMQKIGHYYDHRMNRLKLRQWIEAYKHPVKTAVDLFCYSGSWGLNALKADDEMHMDFVDQGNFEQTIEKNLDLNSFKGRGKFHRADVFDWCKANKDSSYDLIISDPPAFSKSLKNKSKALGGYQKLHKLLAEMSKPGTLLAIGSCTHGVTLEELDQTVNQSFWDTGKNVTLLEIGLQGADHPIATLNDSSNYIKFLLYRVNAD